MYTSFPILLLLPLLATTTPTPSPEPLTTIPALNTTGTSTNITATPSFMTGTNQTLSAWARSGCGNNTNGAENVWFPNLLYGKVNHGLAVSFMLGRDMKVDEFLDMTFFVDDKGSKPADGTDAACGRFQYRASPDEEENPLMGGVCYTPSVPVTCIRMWKSD